MRRGLPHAHPQLHRRQPRRPGLVAAGAGPAGQHGVPPVSRHPTGRPGGGPARDGANARRNDPLIQRAWYNGWKKLHGMKWQTVDLPNGMNFHVWGPISIRHNDLESHDLSEINAKLAQLQIGEMYQFVSMVILRIYISTRVTCVLDIIISTILFARYLRTGYSLAAENVLNGIMVMLGECGH